MEAIKQKFSDMQNHPCYKPVMELFEITLKKNDFQFNDETYLQSSGTTMGKKFAPSYCNIFMALWEEQILNKNNYQPLVYFRFLDDIFMIWTHGIEKFNAFFESMNSHHPSIKLEATISDKQINFSDTTIFKHPSNPSRVLSKVYFKETDTHQLLDKKSFHPKHTFSGIIKSQVTRFPRIYSLPTDFDEACKTLFGALQTKNY